MITQENGGITTHIVKRGTRWWWWGSLVWPLNQPPGEEEPWVCGRGVAGAGLNAVENSKLCSCKERSFSSLAVQPMACSLYWLSQHLDFILEYCIWMLTKTFTVYSQDHITSKSCNVFCWNCERAEHCMMYSCTLSSGGTVVCMKYKIVSYYRPKKRIARHYKVHSIFLPNVQ